MRGEKDSWELQKGKRFDAASVPQHRPQPGRANAWMPDYTGAASIDLEGSMFRRARLPEGVADGSIEAWRHRTARQLAVVAEREAAVGPNNIY